VRDILCLRGVRAADAKPPETLKGEPYRAAARCLLNDSIRAGIPLIAPPIILATLADLHRIEFWTADKTFFDAVHAELKFVRDLPDYLHQARPKRRKPA
jgi:hypothetical protein